MYYKIGWRVVFAVSHTNNLRRHYSNDSNDIQNPYEGFLGTEFWTNYSCVPLMRSKWIETGPVLAVCSDLYNCYCHTSIIYTYRCIHIFYWRFFTYWQTTVKMFHVQCLMLFMLCCLIQLSAQPPSDVICLVPCAV